MNSSAGSLLLVLHAHLPFVRHPEHENFLEERWLYEALTETYIPLAALLGRLHDEGVFCRLTLSVSPPLAAMLQDELLQERYSRHLARLIELAEKEMERTRQDPAFHRLAVHYHEVFREARKVFEDHYGRNLIRAFKRFQDSGALEIITCAATHGFLPLMAPVPQSVRAQIRIGCESYEKTFGRQTAGIWLPECAYAPELGQILKEYGISYYFSESNCIINGNPSPKYGLYAPFRSTDGVFAFGRDPDSSKQVWSAEEGYPGDPHYREFYRDIGFDLDYDYIQPYIHPDGFRINTGIKYYRITGSSSHKEPYDPEKADSTARQHARHFLEGRRKQCEGIRKSLGIDPVITAPYDAELFGHWWHEGPQFLESVIRQSSAESIELVTAPDYLGRDFPKQGGIPAASSWGHKGYYEYWLEASNDWVYRHLHHASGEMQKLAREFPAAEGLEKRALNQAARELLLAESSDWAFIMKTGTMVPYAVARTRGHILNFLKLRDQVRSRVVDLPGLQELEKRDNIFPWIDYRIYS